MPRFVKSIFQRVFYVKKYLKNTSGIASKVIWSLSAVCGLLSFFYYLSTGNSFFLSLFSSVVVLFLSMFAISFVVGAISGVVESVLHPQNEHTTPKNPDSTKETSSFTEEVFEVVGTYYYLENIGKLATRNPDWRKQGKTLAAQGHAGRRVYRYKYINKPVKLIQENKNPHDHNAVMVQIAGEKVGYISADEAVHVRTILNKHSVKFISAFIGGGDYKEVFSDGTFQKYEDDPFINVKIGYR